MKKNSSFQQVCSDVCVYNGDTINKSMKETPLNSKTNAKKLKLMHKWAEQVIKSEGRLKCPFQIEIFSQQPKLDDKCVERMSSELVHALPQRNLQIDLTKKWHSDLSEITDKGIMDLSSGLSKLSKLDQLTLALYGWGYWNQSITNKSLNYLTQALFLQNNLTEFKLDLNMWAYENESITDEGANKLMDGIGWLSNLGKLELNLKGWGDSNQSITDNTILGLAKCLEKLGNLSEVKLILWDSIGRQAVKQLNKTLSKMEHLTKVDIKYESCSSQTVVNHDIDLKLQQIKMNAVQKRRLLFQVEAIINNLSDYTQIRSLWNVAIKL